MKIMETLMKGIGACSGIAKGKVQIIKDLRKIENVKKGTIIVMKYFSPLLTIHLSKVKGMLTDFGGKTCHGAIIAREFRIPCIVSLNEATKKLKEGQEIIIDGKTGEVYGIKS